MNRHANLLRHRRRDIYILSHLASLMAIAAGVALLLKNGYRFMIKRRIT